jgi:ATP-dependent helicase/DNAse subunit B
MLSVVRGVGLPTLRAELRSQCTAMRREGRGERFLWLVPTHRWALWIQSDLVRASASCAAPEPRVFDLRGLLTRVAEEPPPLPRGHLELMIADAIEQDAQAAAVFVNRQGRARAGAVRLLAKTLIQIHRSGQDVPPLRRGADGAAAAVLRRVEQRLRDRSRADEGAHASRLRAAITPEQFVVAFGKIDLAVIDGFDEFDPDFRRVLNALTAAAEDVVMLIDDDPSRPRLRQHMIPAIDEIFEEAAVKNELRDPDATPLATAFARPPGEITPELRDRLATLESRTTTHDSRVTFQLCRTPHDEVVWIARKIKRWSRNHPDIPLSRIAVTFANPERMAPLVREVFAAWGVPHNIDPESEKHTLANAPLGQAALALLRVAASDFAWRDLQALARNRVWRGTYRLDPAAVAHEARELRIAQGADLWRERVAEAVRTSDRLAHEASDTIPEMIEDIGALRQQRRRRLRSLQRALERLASDLEPLRRAATLSGAIETLCEILIRRRALERLLLITGADDTATLAPHLRAFEVLQGAAQSLRDSPEGAQTLPLERAVQRVQMLFEAQELRERPPDVQSVQVLGHLELRGIPWAMIFVGGLNEGAWPHRPRVSPFGESSPLAVGQSDADVDLARQRHTFFQILRSGADRLLFTRPSTVDDMPQNPSPFLEEIAGLLGRAHEIATPDDNVVPWKLEDVQESADCLSPRELQWVAGSALEPSLETASPESVQACVSSAPLAPLARGVEIVRARRQWESWSRWEGILEDAGLKSHLAARDAAHIWSASELESFGGCAWRGGVERLLHLERPEDDAARIHALERGVLIHHTLHAFCEKWRAHTNRERADIRPDETDAAWSLMRRVAEEQLRARPEAALLWNVEREILLGSERRRGVLEAFIHQEAARTDGLAPIHLEWGFGWSESDDAPPALEIAHDGRVHHIRGLIDRVECDESHERWAVVDYKTGTTPITEGKIRDGLHLQLPLYAMAIASMWAEGDADRVHGAIRQIARLDKMETKWLLDEKKAPRAEEHARWHVDRIAREVAGGALHWTTRPFRALCVNCGWRRTCRRDESKVAAMGEPEGPPA